MGELHKDVQKAIEGGILEGIAALDTGKAQAYISLAEVITPLVVAFEAEGMSETRAMKAAILFVNYSDWKDD